MAAEIQRMLREKPTSMREIQAALLQNYDTAQMEPEAVEKLAAMEAAILGLAEKYVSPAWPVNAGGPSVFPLE